MLCSRRAATRNPDPRFETLTNSTLTPSCPLAGLQLPAQAHEVLRALLRRLWDTRRCEPVRLPLTGALLEYLQLSRGPRLLRLPPAVLQAVLKGARS